MKKTLCVLGLALALTLAAERRAAAEGGFKICFAVSASKWNGCGGGDCGNACFPCVDPALFGLGGGNCGYPGSAGYPMPYPYAAPAAPAPAQPAQYQPWGNFSGYQPVG